mmetsp:Transcript_21982/g.24412  ORF Transcript_21982/g.24412 Transcript_21982/m.24412 type:complete len:316 (+) Transcript_21982:8-955(+)|eukprot:CAMPEP_0205805808 /NCGR_PEP_ID=MMETSP0205-20121125/9139_1 /ASSEMBLY_ACC=CAM_ASM_000278 /TAXON_ID=36767 /ORGANISM="Euplotes focardii, Strain TN1" /LENGTH=315 /DNA_ID=CAMNT_0053077611 /DNA_START=7 /DNA_END=954 /DNA_ORIENTATION=-
MAKSGNPFLTCCWLTLLILVISLLVSLVCLYFGQDQLIYQNDYPSPYEEYPEENQEGKRNPGEKSMKYEDITIETEDDVRLSGWFIHNAALTPTLPTIIYMHGSSGNIGHSLSWAENIYFNLKANIVLVGYRGYGHSEGSPNENGLEKDSKSIIKWTLENKDINSEQVYVMGNVLGGAVATFGVQFFQDQVKGIILQNTFKNFGNAVDDTNWLFRLLRPLILANYWPTDERIKNIVTPILFISGSDSDTHDDMQDLRRLAVHSQITEFLTIPRAGKENTWRVGGRSYLTAIENFFLETKFLINIPIETDEGVESI